MTTNDNLRKQVAVAVRMTAADVRRLDEQAMSENRTRSNLVSKIVIDYLNEVKA